MKRDCFFARILPLALLLACMVLPAYADTGPKPSVTVTVEGLDGRECYVTLLSAARSTGPYKSSVKERSDGTRYYDGTEVGVYWVRESPFYTAIWERFMDYQLNDPEKLYFLEEFSAPDEAGQIRHGYYPPQSFKILFYFPETDSFAVTSELLERYAFDSYYTVDLTGLELAPGGTVSGLAAQRSYDYRTELTGLAVRAAVTVAVELALALCFRLNTKRQLLLILLVNLLTQTGLNLGLNWFAYHNGANSIVVPYLMMEIAVVLAEFFAYRLWMTDIPGEKRTSRVGWYACIANTASFLAGTALMEVFPLVF